MDVQPEGLGGGALCAVGLMHSYQWQGSDTVIWPGWPWQLQTWPWVPGYGCMGLVFLSARWLTASDEAKHG